MLTLAGSMLAGGAARARPQEGGGTPLERPSAHGGGAPIRLCLPCGGETDRSARLLVASIARVAGHALEPVHLTAESGGADPGQLARQAQFCQRLATLPGPAP